MSEEPLTPRESHEAQLVRAFLLPQRQERYVELLSKPHRRKDVTDKLAHFKHIDMRWAVAIPSNEQHTANILLLLKAKGAPDTCYAISEDDDLDGKEIPLGQALKTIVGSGIGTFLSCLPGRLAYFEDEDCRWILERKKRLEAR
jgi:hypothetical protein